MKPGTLLNLSPHMCGRFQLHQRHRLLVRGEMNVPEVAVIASQVLWGSHRLTSAPWMSTNQKLINLQLLSRLLSKGGHNFGIQSPKVPARCPCKRDATLGATSAQWRPRTPCCPHERPTPGRWFWRPGSAQRTSRGSCQRETPESARLTSCGSLRIYGHP